MPAKEEKSLTAKAAKDVKETIFEPTPEKNAKTSPSMEMAISATTGPSLVACCKSVAYHSGGAITTLGAVLAGLEMNLLLSLRVLGGLRGKAFPASPFAFPAFPAFFAVKLPNLSPAGHVKMREHDHQTVGDTTYREFR